MSTEITQSVLCYGEALWDVTPEGRLPGGAPMNVALRLAALGVETRLLSRVGDDDLGRELLAYIAERGLPTAPIQVDPEQPTGRVNVDTSDRHAVRYDIVAPAAWDFIDAARFLEEEGGQVGAVVFGSLVARSAVSRRSLLQILDRSSLSIFDVNLRPPFDGRDTVEELLRLSSWVKVNETELALICGWLGVTGEPEAMLSAIADHYALDVVCVTFGGDGAMLYHAGEFLRQAAFEVEVVDTIGCGDAFLGTWLAEMLAGEDPGRALQRACAVGAIVASQAGANPVVTESMIRAVCGDA